MSRLAQALSLQIKGADRPFSNFDFVDREFSGSAPIRRLFSQARSRGAKTLVMEKVAAQGAVADENAELGNLFPDYQMAGLVRLSFWRTSLTRKAEMAMLRDADCMGWAILKLDQVGGRQGWHVFESVIRAYEHPHSFATCARAVPVKIAGRKFEIPGVLYCQQNGLNKACAQVALRSICSAFLDDPDLTFRRINQLAAAVSPVAKPGEGLTTDQIQGVLDGLGIPHFAIFYPNLDGRQKWRSRLPYQKILYSGIESGCGALLAFTTSGPRAPGCGHIVPLLGHTFNEDTWSARGDGAYFKIGKDIRYLPSSAWMSSFLIHDDNFGSNLCVAKDYLPPKQADYVVALYPRGYAAPGFVAEVASSRYFYSLLRQLDESANPWVNRLHRTVKNKELILRTVPITREAYCQHVREMQDWEHHTEDSATVDDLARLCPDRMWMIEVSIPDLFSTNLRKLGELLLSADLTISDRPDYQKFVLSRFPGCYMLFDRLDGRRQPRFVAASSGLQTHTPLWTRRL